MRKDCLVGLFSTVKMGHDVICGGLVAQIGIQLQSNEYYHTVTIATEKFSNSEVELRCYDNFEGDNNRVVIILINTCCDHFKTLHSLIDFSFLFFRG